MGRDSPKILYRPMNQARGMRAAACIFRARFTSSHNNSTAKRFCLTSIDPRTGAAGCPRTNPKLDKEERDLLTSVEAGEWESVPELEEGILRHWEYANTLKKGRRVNIRISLSALGARRALHRHRHWASTV